MEGGSFLLDEGSSENRIGNSPPTHPIISSIPTGNIIAAFPQDGSVGTDGALTVAAAPDGETILIAGYTGYNETVVGSEDLIAVMFSTDPSATVPTPSPALASAPQTPAPVAAVAPLTPTLAPTPATAVLPIFDVPEEMSPAFAGMGVSTISMALLVLGCCCWGGRTKKM